MRYDSLGTTTVVDEASTVPAFVSDTSYALVIDDDQAILSVIMLLLETEGYAGLGFSNSQKVFSFLEQVREAEKEGEMHFPSVILLDLMMPVISGYEIAAWLSKHEWTAHIPIIIMTADHRVHGIDAVPGANDLMSKPFPVNVLLSKLERYLLPTLTT